MDTVDHGLEFEVVVVVTDLQTVIGRLDCCRIELSCNLADARFGLPAGRVDVRLDHSLDAEFGRQCTDRILIFTQQVDMRCRCGQLVFGKAIAQLVAKLSSANGST